MRRAGGHRLDTGGRDCSHAQAQSQAKPVTPAEKWCGGKLMPKIQEDKATSRAIKPRSLGLRPWMSWKAPLPPDVVLRGGRRAPPWDGEILIENLDPDLIIFPKESKFFYLNNLFLFLAAPCNLRDLSSLTRDWTRTLGSEWAKSYPLDHQGIPLLKFFALTTFQIYRKVTRIVQRIPRYLSSKFSKC